MRLYPTAPALEVALAGALVVLAGALGRRPEAVLAGGAVVAAVSLGRALAHLGVSRIRASGFEMIWRGGRQVHKLFVGDELTLAFEVRNRSDEPALGVRLRPLASSLLDVTVTPEERELPARSACRFELRIRGARVGRWGVHGVALEARGMPAGGEGLYEAPLVFANPQGVEVRPRGARGRRGGARARRPHQLGDAGSRASRRGDGDHLRELRELVPGDSLRKVAWKASARRGKLVVRETDVESRMTAWVLVDASVELWAGAPGEAPLDRALDDALAAAETFAARGARVGLCVYASRTRTLLAPDVGKLHLDRVAGALTSAASCVDLDRCELTEEELALRVMEHLRPLDPRGLADVPRGDLDRLAARAEAIRPRAPFAPRLPLATSVREQRLRHHLAAFGVEVPPRLSGERDAAEATLARELGRLLEDRRHGLTHLAIFAPAPGGAREIDACLRRARAARVEVTWSLPSFETALARATRGGLDAAGAVEARLAATRAAGRARLERLGARTGRP